MDRTIIMEADAKDAKILSTLMKEQALKDINEDEYKQHIRIVCGREVLDYAKSLVINLPGTCYANCSYCIDKDLRPCTTDYLSFLQTCRALLSDKSDFKEISITGGSLPPTEFNMLMMLIRKQCPGAKITWNTNGAHVNAQYDVSDIKYINLHRNSANDNDNREIFQSKAPILSINEAKVLFEDKLCVRVTVDEDFDLDEYAKYEVPLYLNRLLPGTEASEQRFHEVLDRLAVSEDVDIRRRNQYLNGYCKEIPVRICLGDRLAERIQNRYPMWLNVVIIHRDGTVCGSWYPDDKFLFKL